MSHFIALYEALSLEIKFAASVLVYIIGLLNSWRRHAAFKKLPKAEQDQIRAKFDESYMRASNRAPIYIGYLMAMIGGILFLTMNGIITIAALGLIVPGLVLVYLSSRHRTD